MNIPGLPTWESVTAHYDRLAVSYDQFFKFVHTQVANFMKNNIPLTKNDQIVDIGGGTGEILHLLWKELSLETPGVCVEPNKSMLQIASSKEGVIPVLATAEEFLATRPNYIMKVVVLNGMLHYIKDIPNVVENISKYIREDNGICAIIQHQFDKNVWFEDAFKEIPVVKMDMEAISESCGLQCVPFEWKEAVEVSKEEWYEGLRQHFIASLNKYSDEEIEQGIRTIEEKCGKMKTLKFTFGLHGWILKPRAE